MGIASRIAALRLEAGGGARAPARQDDDRARALAELRTAVLRRRGDAGARRAVPAVRRDDHALADSLAGEVVARGVVRREEHLPSGARRGRQALSAARLPAALGLLCGGDGGSEAGSVVFMDTETTGLSGGSGTLAFLLGIARFGDRGLEIRQLLLTGFHGEHALLELAADQLAGCTTLVTYNGRSFDAPLLAARYRLARLADPFARLAHVDLLHATRRAFARQWPDCRLQTAERRLLGYQRADDLPGAAAPLAWFDWVREGRAEMLARACAHNRDDVVSLAALAIALERCHLDPLQAEADVYACARFAALRGDGDRAYAYLLERRSGLDRRASRELARIACRRDDWAVALEVWEALAREGDLHALEALAKYHEHRDGDLPRALSLTRILIERSPGEARHLRRLRRLLARRARGPRR